MEELSQLDLVFCVDLTTSMQPFIRAAQKNMVAILRSLASTNQADLRVGVIGFRDHSEFERTTEVYHLNKDLRETQSVLEALVAQSPTDNMDAAEAVIAGLLDSVAMEWRPYAYRIVLLVGDAPPHGCGASKQPHPDRWPDRDPTGVDLSEVGARFEEQGITAFALSMSPSVIPVHDPIMLQSFSRLAALTGGLHRDARNAGAAMELLKEISTRVFRNLDLDRTLWEKFFRDCDPRMGLVASAPALKMMSRALNIPEAEASASFDRLQRKLQLGQQHEQDQG